METFTVMVQQTLRVCTCVRCGCQYGVPATKLAELREFGGPIWCPNGHKLYFPEQSKVADAKLRAMHAAEQAEARAADAKATA